MDVRLGNKRSRHRPGIFNPWDKECGNYEVCCKGKCKNDQVREDQNSKKSSRGASGDDAGGGLICPGDYTGETLVTG